MQNILQLYPFQFNFFWKYFETRASLLTIEEEDTEMNSSDLQSKINYFNTTVFYKSIPEAFPPSQLATSSLLGQHHQAAAEVHVDPLT